ncbi:hypothetical protein [Salaquimonas pukyongi]|uniref:hypothetical protein n=1 Tax=Salaquimonas pukyongi TaxID=2712698 RepID=UPI00096BA559|nr:hypothetical protein [Salaquimonas pukyongi]
MKRFSILPGFLIATVLTALLADVGGQAQAANPYMSQDKVMRVARQMQKKGKIPTNLQCTVDRSKRYLNPQIKIEWKDNNRNIEWYLNVYKGQLEFKPNDIGNWKRISRTVIPLRSTKFFCLLYYKR